MQDISFNETIYHRIGILSFNHYVTFLFLNWTEVGSQMQLLEVLPKLYSGLTFGKTDTLQNCVVSIHGMSSPVLTNNLPTKIQR